MTLLDHSAGVTVCGGGAREKDVPFLSIPPHMFAAPFMQPCLSDEIGEKLEMRSRRDGGEIVGVLSFKKILHPNNPEVLIIPECSILPGNIVCVFISSFSGNTKLSNQNEYPKQVRMT